MRRGALAFTLCAACGGSGGDIIDSGPHEATPDAPRPGDHIVVVYEYGTTALAYRNGDGPWQLPFPIGPGRYEIDVDDAYQLAYGCGDATGFEVTIDGLTFSEDGDSTFAVCTPPGPSPLLANVTVTGHMLQPGDVFLYDLDSSSTAPWDFSITAPPGTHDFFAITADHAAIRRDLSLATDMDLGTIDVDTEGAPLDLVPLTIAGVEVDAQISSTGIWFATNDLAILLGDTTAHLPPPSLSAGDEVYLGAEADTAAGYQSGFVVYSGSENTFDMMPIPAGVTLATDPPGVAWASVPLFTAMRYRRLAAGGSSIEVNGSVSWIQQSGATSLTGDLTAAEAFGFDPSWTIAAGREYFEVIDDSGTIDYTSAAAHDF